MQRGASDSSVDSQEKESNSQKTLKGLNGQKMTLQIQIEMNRRLLKSNLDR